MPRDTRGMGGTCEPDDASETRMTITTDRPAHAEPEHGTAPPALHATLQAPAGAATLEAMRLVLQSMGIEVPFVAAGVSSSP